MLLKDRKLVTVLLVVYNEAKSIDDALQSVKDQTYGTNNLELIVVDGGSTDGTIDKVSDFLESNKSCFYGTYLLDNPGRILASGWNIGVRAASGDYVVRFDGHSKIYPEYIIEGVDILENDAQVGAVGGWLNHVGEGFFGEVVGCFYSSKLGAGGAVFRKKPESVVKGDTAVFAIYRKDQMIKAGLFDEKLARNQDIDFHKRFKAQGMSFATSPAMKIDYEVRASFSGLLKKAYGDGCWIPRSNGVKARHYAPLVFLCFLSIALMLGSAYFSAFIGLYSLLLISWFLLKDRFAFSYSGVLPVVTFMYHAAYGLGIVRGLFARVIR